MQMSDLQAKSTNSLALCPFCGGNAKLTTWTPTAASISCIMCGAHFNTYTEAEAIAAWNSRAERTCEFAPDGMMDDRLWFACSNCGGYITTDYGMPSYCPHCGARRVGV